MKAKLEIAMPGYRTSRTGRTNGETVSHNGFTRFTQRIYSFHTTDFTAFRKGFSYGRRDDRE